MRATRKRENCRVRRASVVVSPPERRAKALWPAGARGDAGSAGDGSGVAGAALDRSRGPRRSRPRRRSGGRAATATPGYSDPDDGIAAGAAAVPGSSSAAGAQLRKPIIISSVVAGPNVVAWRESNPRSLARSGEFSYHSVTSIRLPAGIELGLAIAIDHLPLLVVVRHVEQQLGARHRECGARSGLPPRVGARAATARAGSCPARTSARCRRASDRCRAGSRRLTLPIAS